MKGKKVKVKEEERRESSCKRRLASWWEVTLDPWLPLLLLLQSPDIIYPIYSIYLLQFYFYVHYSVSLIRQKHNLLHLHRIKQLIRLHGLRERHNLLRHKSISKVSHLCFTRVKDTSLATHPSLCWFFFKFSSASGVIDRTGHRPI